MTFLGPGDLVQTIEVWDELPQCWTLRTFAPSTDYWSVVRTSPPRHHDDTYRRVQCKWPAEEHTPMRTFYTCRPEDPWDAT